MVDAKHRTIELVAIVADPVRDGLVDATKLLVGTLVGGRGILHGRHGLESHMGNEVITLVKDTSLAFSIGIIEMFTQSRALVASQRSMIPFAMAAAIYWVTCLLIEFALRMAEKKLDYYHD